MPKILEVNTARRMAYYHLTEALKETRDEINGITIREISGAMRESMSIEEIAALMNELGEYTSEFNSNE